MSLDFWQVTSTETKISAPSGGRVSINSPVALHRTTVQNLGLSNVVTAGAGTYTAAILATGLITRDPTGASRADEVDTAANILAAIPALANDGDTFECKLLNTADAAEVITLGGAPAAGITYANAGQTLAQNEACTLLLRRTSATTVTVYIIGA